MNSKYLLLTTLAVATVLSVTTTSSFAATNLVTPEAQVPIGEDLTNSFTTTMRKNAAYMAYYAMNEQNYQGTYPVLTGQEFASKVRTGGVWDYKQYYGGTVQYMYNGLYVTGADVGNMHYGFVGRGAGFPDTLLKTAAGAYQIYSGTWYIGWYSSYFDDPRDQYWINYGIGMYNNNSWPRTISFNSTQIDTSLFNLLSDQEKKEIRNKVIKDAEKLK
ncbi:hypothetical protein CIG75_05890 [Tumebacillus algifaecis]|uniref:Bacterial toxin 44 domain-containing protein n=1 Tax=Tumebacillus algifaecis TaxID=1214604 RepID=A0A223CYS4_9BACL|nr:polymorphic toxin type 44 domain-containing protein [Tumebacillus algifaecis]ASS74569.1 hypothetical protein CIG75_05890 [Tumebacillus algifaecis]